MINYLPEALFQLTSLNVSSSMYLREDANSNLIKNIVKGLAVGWMLNVAQQLMSKTPSLNGRMILIPTVITAAISATAYIARRCNVYADKANHLEKVIGRILDVAIPVISLGTLALSARNAMQAPISFFVAGGVAVVNLYDCLSILRLKLQWEYLFDLITTMNGVAGNNNKHDAYQETAGSY